jgi:lysophospholipase L1-like esterase
MALRRSRPESLHQKIRKLSIMSKKTIPFALRLYARTSLLIFFPLLSLAMARLEGSFPFPKISAGLVVAFLIGYVLLRNPSTRANLSIFFTSLFFGLVMFDLLLRIFPPGMLYYRVHERYTHTYPRFPLVSRYYPNVTYKESEYGDLVAMGGNQAAKETREVTFRTDSLGFRNYSSSGPYDFILMGDSFGVGLGVDQEKTTAALLQKKLKKNAYNVSMPGSPWQEYANFYLLQDSISVKRDGTVLWFLFSGNDLDDVYASTNIESLKLGSRFSPYLIEFKTWQRRSIIRQFLSRFTNKTANPVIEKEYRGQTILFYENYLNRSKKTLEELKANPNTPLLIEAMRAMKTLTEQKQLHLVIVAIPSKEEIYSEILGQQSNRDRFQTAFASLIQKLAEENGIQYLNSGPYLLVEAAKMLTDGKFLWWRDDTHLNEAGHQALSDFLASRLGNLAPPKN